MKRSSLVSLVTLLISLSIYFLIFDPMFRDNRWAAFIAYMVIFISWMFLNKKLQGRFEILEKRIDPQTSVWTVIAILFFFFAFFKAVE